VCLSYLRKTNQSGKFEIMVASCIWEGATLWFDISLLITTTRRYDWGASPCCSSLLFGAWHVDLVAIFPTCQWEEVHNSWKRASTEEYKTRLGFLLLRAIHRYKPGLKKGEGGSFPARQAGEFGIVCSRQGGRKGNKQIKVERLSFGKIWFYGVRTHYGGSTTYYSLLSGL